MHNVIGGITSFHMKVLCVELRRTSGRETVSFGCNSPDHYRYIPNVIGGIASFHMNVLCVEFRRTTREKTVSFGAIVQAITVGSAADDVMLT